jgi:membrane-bound metal-dependent hydrolase YbcI (DUF457 family)
MVNNEAMPSPLGHALGGIAVSWAADLMPGRRAWRSAGPAASFYRRAGGALTLSCAGLAMAPDADLLLFAHRTATHSLTAVAVVTGIAAVVTGWFTRGTGYPTARVALMCGAAYASHLLLDWFGVDRFPPSGLQVLWPFSDTWFISGVDLFVPTERRELYSFDSLRANALAMASETAMLLPIIVVLWLVRIKTLSRFSAQLTRSDHPAQEGARPVL